MLQELHIRNFALIDRVDIEFASGLNLLTGETGAGKSIVIDALGLTLGDRVSGAESIRTGASFASVEAVYSLAESSTELKERLIAEGVQNEDDLDTLLITREISASGKNQCRINGKLCPVSMLREICRPLIDIHGQHEHQAILSASSHIDLLDNWLGDKVLSLREQALTAYTLASVLQEELLSMRASARERARNTELIKFQIDEIESAELIIGEEEELLAEKNRLSNAEKLSDASDQACNLLGGPAQDSINSAFSSLQRASLLDPELASITEQLANAIELISDARRTLRRYRENVEYNPQRLQEIEDRLHAISGLKRKYGETIDDIISYLENSKIKLVALENQEEREADLEEQIALAKRSLQTISDQLTAVRKEGSLRFSKNIMTELNDLGMAATRFETQIESQPPTTKGADKVEFLLSPNPGEPLKPLAKIASGGEASRIMLAIKSVLAKSGSSPTMIFDEIDTGVGGRTAFAVAKKLESLSGKTQIICITHLPQIASRAALAHFYIEKKAESDKTEVFVKRLSQSERVIEISRMLGGAPEDSAAIEHAKQMLQNIA